MGEGGGRDWEGMQDRHAERPIGRGCRLQGDGPLQGGEEGLRVVSHLHSPIKFLYFRKNKKA